MFTLIDTYSPAVIATRSQFAGTAVLACDLGWLHTDITLARASMR